MDIHNLIVDTRNSIMDVHNSIVDIHSIQTVDIHNCKSIKSHLWIPGAIVDIDQ